MTLKIEKCLTAHKFQRIVSHCKTLFLTSDYFPYSPGMQTPLSKNPCLLQTLFQIIAFLPVSSFSSFVHHVQWFSSPLLGHYK